ncbi:unnamed protein product [Didymodactylos carnosus]|uniref:TLDc domain-containing protein n=1 Tax=Didymodactylos carnosus TaxID=1234261 RepID=A0A814GUN8_9BILA|nr:unnamed protein product [Didymodactylos carnosus]CAF3772524.1 unnamed protein product [Didymodactylos carnosus]
MSSSKQCEIIECKRTAATLCRHCNKDVCKKHFIEHADSLNDELHPLTDQINELTTKLNGLKSLHIVEQSYAILNKWRNDSFLLIEQLYDRKRYEIDVLVEQNFIKVKNEQEEVIRSLEEKIKKFIRDDDVTYDEIKGMKEIIRNISKETEKLKQNFIDIQTEPLYINKNCITVRSKINLVKEVNEIKSVSLFDGTALLSHDQQLILNRFYGKSSQQWKLIYKAVRDGFDVETFHRLCDNFNPTITVIQSEGNGYLFGGYTNVTWNLTSGPYKKDATAFLFTLTNPYNIPPTKYKVYNSQHAIFQDPHYGPTFGGEGEGSDICVFIETNAGTIHFPQTYIDTSGKGNKTFTGYEQSKLSDIEIFKCI